MIPIKKVLKNETRLEKIGQTLEHRIDRKLKNIEPDVDIVDGIITLHFAKEEKWSDEVIVYVLRKYFKGGYKDAIFRTYTNKNFLDEERLEIKLIL